MNGKADASTAALKDNLELIRSLVNAGADVNLSVNGEAPIHKAAGSGCYEVVDSLLSAGAYVNVISSLGETPLASSVNSPVVVRRLISAGALVDLADKKGEAPIHKAARAGAYEVVDSLLSAGAAVNITNNVGDTCLHVAVSNNSLKVAQLLIKYGADTHSVDRHEETPLHIALRKRRAFIKEAVKKNGKADLSTAALKDNLELIRTILKTGADVDLLELMQTILLTVAGVDLESPIDGAIGTRFYEMLDILLNAGGATVRIARELRQTLLLIAANKGNFLVVMRLVQAGLDVNLANTDGITSIHMAARSGCVEVVDFLINAGASVDIATRLGRTPLVIAIYRNNLEVVRRLVMAGAEVNPAVVSPRQPYHRTSYMHDADIADIASVGAMRRMRAAQVRAGFEVNPAIASAGESIGIASIGEIEDKLSSVNFGTLRFSFDEMRMTQGNPLAVATSLGRLDIVRYLRSVGASLEAAGGAHTLLLHAADGGSLEMIEALGLDVNLKDADGSTLLQVLVEKNRRQAVETMIKAGADLSITDQYQYGMTALEVAEELEYLSIAAILKAAMEPKVNVMEDYIHT